MIKLLNQHTKGIYNNIADCIKIERVHAYTLSKYQSTDSYVDDFIFGMNCNDLSVPQKKLRYKARGSFAYRMLSSLHPIPDAFDPPRRPPKKAIGLRTKFTG